LDVGPHWSWSYYAPSLRELLANKIYDGVDVIEDRQTAVFLNHYYIGNVCDISLNKYDYVSCISVIEHCGLSTYKLEDFRAEQYRVFSRMLALSNKYLFLTFPFGLDHIYPGEYANITNMQLLAFEAMAKICGFEVSDLQFYFNEFSPGGEPWQYITREEASLKPMRKERGAQCICLVEFTKNNLQE
jgi:hypothetical protein